MLNVRRTLINIDRGCSRPQERRASLDSSVGRRNKCSQRLYCGICTGNYLSQLRWSKHQGTCIQPLAMTFTFVSSKEEGFVFDDRAADVTPDLIPFEGRHWERVSSCIKPRVEGIPGIEKVVSDVVIHFAVELVCTRA